MATQDVKIYTIKVDGGMTRFMPQEQIKLLMEKGKRAEYSDWDYGCSPELNKREDWLAYKETKTFEQLQEEFPKFESLQLDLQEGEFLDLIVRGVPYTLVSHKTLKVSFNPTEIMDNLYQQTLKMSEKFAEQMVQMSSNTFNQRCNVHSGSVGLHELNQTLLLEDVCTDQLQRHLNDGWRILAVCVQPDQRRPDYVLGKHVVQPSSSAERSYL